MNWQGASLRIDFQKHGIILAVEEIAVSNFKATCLSVLERVRVTRKPILVTRFGKPIAQLIPYSVPERRVIWLGALAGSARVVGDIVSPTADERDWAALRR